MAGDKLFVEDLWLSTVIGRAAHRLETEALEDAASLTRALDGKKFVYAKAPTRDLKAIEILVSARFRLVDTNVTFETERADFKTAEVPERIRFATPADAHKTVELAARSFSSSRFHLDPSFGSSLADKVKGEWVRSYFQGTRGSQMVLAEERDRITGFLLLLDQGSGGWVIDLIAVDADSRGRGLARGMIAFASRNCRRFERIRVGTQIANVDSIRLYEGLGFRFHGARHVFHFHG